MQKGSVRGAASLELKGGSSQRGGADPLEALLWLPGAAEREGLRCPAARCFPAPVEQVAPPGSKLFVDSGSLPPDERKAFSLHQPAGSWREDLVGLENMMQREADEQGPVCFKDDGGSLTGL